MPAPGGTALNGSPLDMRQATGKKSGKGFPIGVICDRMKKTPVRDRMRGAKAIMKKRISALFLAACMALSMLPGQALAAETVPPVGGAPTPYGGGRGISNI